MGNVASYLRTQADSIDDTASRCTDPMIVSELQEISTELREKAEKLERGCYKLKAGLHADTDWRSARV